jgi:putative ABC transport system permease protein
MTRASGLAEETSKDFHFAVRTLRKSPVLTLAALLTLALGIGANTAMFTVIRAVLLKPIPFAAPDRLVRLSLDDVRNNAKDVGFNQVRYEELRTALSFREIGVFFIAHEDMTLTGNGDPESIKVGRVSHNFLRILGIEPVLGRSFLPEEDTPGGRPVVLISAELWQRRFGTDPLIAGKTVNLNSIPTTIIGVLPPGFAFPASGLDAWVARPSEYSGLAPQLWRTAGYLVGIGRLKGGVSLEQASAELGVLSGQYAANHPNESASTMRVALLRDQLVANVRPMLWMLLGAVGFVMLIACANVASLLLGRATSRSREFAIRAALGAPRRRLIAQLLTESLLLAGCGGAIGIALAGWAISTVVHWNALALPRAGEVRLDATVLLCTFGAAMLSGLLFGLFPSVTALRLDLMNSMRVAGGEGGSAPRAGRLGVSVRGLLVIAQVALCVVLLVGTGLLLKSLARLTGIDPGFRSANLLTMQIALPTSRYNDWRKQIVFFEKLIQQVGALPGVRGAAVARTLPMTARVATPAAVVELPHVNLRDRPQAQMQTVSPGYFQTLEIPLHRGRQFDDHDQPATGRTPLIINERFARLFWPDYPHGQDPIGKHVLIGNQQRGGWEIIGIVADVHERALSTEAIPELYLPLAYNAVATAGVVIRAQSDPRRLVNSVRAQVAAIDHDQAISNVKTMDEMIEESIGQRRVTLALLGAFAGVALMLALVGIYGVMAQSVAQRTKELAIRSALGAQSDDILRLILGEGLVLTVAGIGTGIVGALGLTRFLVSLLFHVRATDPVTFAAIGLLVIVASVAAAYIPAQRASRIDPIAELR